MGDKIKQSSLCNPDEWTTEEITIYQQGRKKELSSIYLKEDLLSDQPGHRAYYINGKKGIWKDEVLEEHVLNVMKEWGKPKALIALEEAALEIY